MDELTAEEVSMFREKLLTLQGELEAAVAGTEESAKTVDLDQEIGRLSRMDALQQQSMAKASHRGFQIRLQQIGTALAAIQAGEYGICRACEEPIGRRRLEARPESPLCVQCQSAREKR